eukprot:gb/GECG01010995.1/.p1 GENE.gb/GECG01010995.1/~~gb/GECG01010995.1/.p1  ORF type:complete len:165 (+),score=14.53 gb/GECG01010995.1/:1-495(+)
MGIWLGLDPLDLEHLIQQEPQAIHVPYSRFHRHRGRDVYEFPLQLALKLGHKQQAEVLLRYGATTLYPDSLCLPTLYLALPWALDDREFLLDVARYHSVESAKKILARLERLVENLQQVPDFDATLKLEFTTWIPLLGRFLPSDTLRVSFRVESLAFSSWCERM